MKTDVSGIVCFGTPDALIIKSGLSLVPIASLAAISAYSINGSIFFLSFCFLVCLGVCFVSWSGVFLFFGGELLFVIGTARSNALSASAPHFQSIIEAFIFIKYIELINKFN